MGLSEDAKRNKRKYIHEYSKRNYKRVPLDVRPEQYDRIKNTADQLGESVNGFIKTAIDERLERLWDDD